MNEQDFDDQTLILAAEDCPPDQFERIHVFHVHEERVIQALCAHGPVLVKGGRGSGKSALMIEASRRMSSSGSVAIGIYLSLRHVPLLRSTGQEYEKLLCKLLSEQVDRSLTERQEIQRSFAITTDVSTLQKQLRDLAEVTKKRIVLIFDDVAHIGREASLEEFFGIFRTISSSIVSCKASIYPGVTRFGVRFDVYNDATVFDLSRDERASGYEDFFMQVVRVRFLPLATKLEKSRSLRSESVASFLGRAVVGNMRAFVYACNHLTAQTVIGFPAIETVLKSLSSDYYWPLLEEIEPKLGIYQPLVATSRDLAEATFKIAAQSKVPSVIVHRDLLQRLSKVFEILEYAGFISKREASRAMRSGGRGPRYALNLAYLSELIQPSRLTKAVFDEWLNPNTDVPTDIHTNSDVGKINQPAPLADAELSVFSLPVDKLQKSTAYPYGLTEAKMDVLKKAGFDTIGKVANATDEELKGVDGIGGRWVTRIRSVVGQAIWM